MPGSKPAGHFCFISAQSHFFSELDIEAALAIIGVLFDVEEVTPVVRQDPPNHRSDFSVPSNIFVRQDLLKPARFVVVALAGVWRRGYDEIYLYTPPASYGPLANPGSRRK